MGVFVEWYFDIDITPFVLYIERTFFMKNLSRGYMTGGLKRVPAIDKCFTVLDLLAQSKDPLGISEISLKLDLNKSTVFNICHTLVDLHILESQRDDKFVFGSHFYLLANVTGKRSTLIQTVHPYMELINEKTRLSVFLGLRSERKTLLIDKVDSTNGIRVSSEIGIQMPSLAGAGIKAMLSQLPDAEIDALLARTELKKYTPRSITDKALYKREILEARSRGVAYDREEYFEGMVAFAIPVKAYGSGTQAAIWVVGLTHQVPDATVLELTDFLKGISEEIKQRLL